MYCTFHFLLIYLGLYHYSKILYFIYFIYGLGLDVLWLNEIGPHLLIFIIILIIIKVSQKYLYNFTSFKIYILLLLFELLMIFFEMLLSYFLFNFIFDPYYFFEIIFLSLILSYPIFLFFSKIDKIK